MTKNIIVLLLFFASWSVSAMELQESVSTAGKSESISAIEKPEFIELDCSSSVNSACKGRYYDKTTQYNFVSPRDRGFWTFYDPLFVSSVDFFQDPLVYDEYNALKAHTCSVNVIKKGVYFTKITAHILITKLEFNQQNHLPRRAFNTFLGLLISALEEKSKIYAWVNQKETGLMQVLDKYFFKESQEILFVSNKRSEAFLFDVDIIQLEVNTQDIYDVLF